MSTIASPRASTSVRSPSSSRTSLDASTTSTARTTTTAPAPRRNRAALRDYYGLKATQQAPNSPAPAPDDPHEDDDTSNTSELDNPNFDAPAYVADILAKQGLSGVLRVESSLVSQIRNLDGSRKSLVYDNYSKLIAATDTIRKMRTNMDPLAPTTSTLAPAVAHIAEVAAGLSREMGGRGVGAGAPKIIVMAEGEGKGERKGEKETVRWVLDTPRRLRELVDDGREEAAVAEWEGVRAVVEAWERRGVEGVGELRGVCERILNDEEV